MINLVKKDFIVSKFYLFAVPGVWAVHGLAAFGLNRYIPAGILLSIAMPSIFVVLEAFYKSDTLHCSLPVRRSTVVHARYFSSFIMVTVGLILTLIFGAVFHNLLPKAGEDFQTLMTLQGILGFLLLVVLFLSFLLPFIFRFELFKGLVVAVSTVIIIVAILWGVECLISIKQGYEILKVPAFKGVIGIIRGWLNVLGTAIVNILMVCLMAVTVLISVKLSARFYTRRDL